MFKQETAAIRASVEKEVRAEQANLDRLKAAGVASWKEVRARTCLVSTIDKNDVFIYENAATHRRHTSATRARDSGEVYKVRVLK